jgi:hypothetical protein
MKLTLLDRRAESSPKTCYNIFRQNPINHLQMQPFSPKFATTKEARTQHLKTEDLKPCLTIKTPNSP